jgi:hypothetical protein
MSDKGSKTPLEQKVDNVINLLPENKNVTISTKLKYVADADYIGDVEIRIKSKLNAKDDNGFDGDFVYNMIKLLYANGLRIFWIKSKENVLVFSITDEG